MPLREDLESNEQGLIDKSLLDESYETPIYCKKKHTHDKRCLQWVDVPNV